MQKIMKSYAKNFAGLHHHTNLKIYLFHKEFPLEWFEHINTLIAPLNSEIIPALVNVDLSTLKTMDHITETTYFRYFAQNLPESRVLYLDCDIVVDSDLSSLYQQPFNANALLAVEDYVLNNTSHYYSDFSFDAYFNAGVLLINLECWKSEKIGSRLMTLSQKYSTLIYADQDVLLHKRWGKLPLEYNYQTFGILDLNMRGLNNVIEDKGFLTIVPTIIHYTSPYKPWKLNQGQPYREKYWFYYRLTWQEIIAKHQK